MNEIDEERRGFAFEGWTASGAKLERFPERALGPVIATQYTLSRGVLKLTAQMPPLGDEDEKTVRLQIERDDEWVTVGEASIHPLARTATFRVPDWDASRPWRYRAAYRLIGADGRPGLGALGLHGLGAIFSNAGYMGIPLLITAFGDEQTHQEARRLGATLLDKPFELDELMHAVRSVLPPRF